MSALFEVSSTDVVTCNIFDNSWKITNKSQINLYKYSKPPCTIAEILRFILKFSIEIHCFPTILNEIYNLI